MSINKPKEKESNKPKKKEEKLSKKDSRSRY
jgi:hypothetical protein